MKAVSAIIQSVQLFMPKSKGRVVFMHIPKTGGISISSAIMKTLGLSARLKGSVFHLQPGNLERTSRLLEIDDRIFLQTFLTYLLGRKDLRFITGHFFLHSTTMEEFGDKWHFITILREPVAKWFSQYFFNRYKSSRNYRIEKDLEDFVKTKRAVEYGRDYVRVFAPGFIGEELSSEAAINATIKNLKEFSLVGKTENMSSFAKDYRALTGGKLFLRRLNRNPASSAVRDEMMTPEVVSRVEELCKPNTQVYENL